MLVIQYRQIGLLLTLNFKRSVYDQKNIFIINTSHRKKNHYTHARGKFRKSARLSRCSGGTNGGTNYNY